MTLSTVNGNVRLSVDNVSANDSIHLNTTNGMITAELPPNIDGMFDLAVTNGVVRTDLPINGDKATPRRPSPARPDRHLEPGRSHAHDKRHSVRDDKGRFDVALRRPISPTAAAELPWSSAGTVRRGRGIIRA